MASRKQHQMSVPAWIWEWGIKNDPQGRFNPAPYLREFLGECVNIANSSPGEEGERSEDDDPAEIDPEDAPAEPVPAPKPKKRRGSMVWLIDKRTGGRLADRWFLSQSKKEEIEGQHKGIDVILHLRDADGRLRYKVKYDPALLEETDANAIGGEPYWVLDVTALKTTCWAKEIVTC